LEKIDPDFVKTWINEHPDTYKELKEKFPETEDADFVLWHVSSAVSNLNHENPDSVEEFAVKNTEIVQSFKNFNYLKHLSMVDSKKISGKDLDLNEKVLLDILYKIMHDDNFKHQIYSTTKSFLIDQLGWRGLNRSRKELHEKLFNHFEALRTGGLAYNIFNRYTGADRDEWNKISSTFVSGFISEHSVGEDNIDDEIVEFSIGTKLRLLLASPKAFAKLCIDINITFKTLQAKKLYEYSIAELGLRNIEFMKKGELVVTIIGIKTIHTLLEINNQELENKKLTMVMERTLKEINENRLSKINIKVLKINEKNGKQKYIETITKGSKEIIGYKYCIIKKPSVEYDFSQNGNNFMLLPAPANKSEPTLFDMQIADESKDSAIKKLEFIYQNKTIAMSIIKIVETKYPDFDLDGYISGCIDYTNSHDVKNFSAYLRNVIEDNHINYTQKTKTKEIKNNVSTYDEIINRYIPTPEWQKCLDVLRNTIPETTMATYFDHLTDIVIVDSETVKIQVPHELAITVLKSNFLKDIETALKINNFPHNNITFETVPNKFGR
jgi:hypothetical protein